MELCNVTKFETASAFRAWLEENHDSVNHIWVGYWKKQTGRVSVTWPETVDQALCFGWIDGIRKRIDDDSYAIRFTQRRSKSVWSRRNIERFEALLADGQVEQSGLEAYERRTKEKSGVYSFEQKTSPELPVELVAIFKADAAAWLDWVSRPPGYRKQASHWVMSARREATRRRRLAELISDSGAGRKVKPLR